MEQPAAAPAPATKLPTRPGPQTSGPAATPAPARAPGVRPAIVGYASSMGLYKNGKPDPAAIKAFQQKNGLKADGIIGPDTSGAILSAAKPGDAGSGRGGQGGPAAYKQNMPPINTQQATTPAVDPTTQSVNQRLAAAFGSGGPRRGYQSGQGTAPVAQAATPVPAATPAADPTKQSVSQRLATGPSLIDQGRARLGIPAGGTSPAAPKAPSAPKAPAAPVTGGATNADRRDFEESVDLMRRMSTMLKG